MIKSFIWGRNCDGRRLETTLRPGLKFDWTQFIADTAKDEVIELDDPMFTDHIYPDDDLICIFAKEFTIMNGLFCKVPEGMGIKGVLRDGKLKIFRTLARGDISRWQEFMPEYHSILGEL